MSESVSGEVGIWNIIVHFFNLAKVYQPLHIISKYSTVQYM